jgi:toxin ParE1/3/4
MRLVWSLLSMEDREGIFDYIERDSFTFAVTVDDRICEHIELLLDFAEMGREGRVEGTRELVIPRTPYIACYRIEGDRIHILRVLHGARRWPGDF